MEFNIIIPARYGSTRLPGKPLLDIAGKPLLQHVYECALKSGATQVVIATDHEEIYDAASRFGATVCMTAEDHPTGTDRIAEVVEALELDENEIIIGLQGDEPLMPPDLIRQLAADLNEHDNVKVASLCAPIRDPELLFNTNVTKVVMNRRNYALYFSRAPIPWERDNFSHTTKASSLSGHHYGHFGIYAYRASFLQDYIQWEGSPIETLECLEQLRILWHGGRIHMVVTKQFLQNGVDTPEDLERVRKIFGHL